jgi:hypothetical protein
LIWPRDDGHPPAVGLTTDSSAPIRVPLENSAVALTCKFACRQALWLGASRDASRRVLGVKVAASTVWEILKDADIDSAPERASSTWSRLRAFSG